MKIAIVSPGLAPNVTGGIQRHSYCLAKYFARLDVDIDLYHTDFGEGPFQRDDLEGMSAGERARITSLCIKWPEGRRIPGHYIRKMKKFSNAALEVFRKRPPVDFVYGQGLTAWAFVKARRRGAAVPPVGVNLHGYNMFQPPINSKNRIQNLMMRPSFGRLARRADYVFSLGGKLTRLIRDRVNVPHERIIQIAGAIDDSWVVSAPSSVSRRRKFVFVGRFDRVKGIEELHDAMKQNLQWQKEMDLCLIGPIPEERRLDLPHVSYLGAVTQEEQLKLELSAADVLICPSHSEGMPTVIMEAMACGLAIIATDVGAVAELVSSSNGILLNAPSPSEITDAIERVLSLSRHELTNLKLRSLQKSDDFKWSGVAQHTYEEINRVTS
jgi:glycosyltransferase involved in cell wall biosynthesis